MGDETPPRRRRLSLSAESPPKRRAPYLPAANAPMVLHPSGYVVKEEVPKAVGHASEFAGSSEFGPAAVTPAAVDANANGAAGGQGPAKQFTGPSPRVGATMSLRGSGGRASNVTVEVIEVGASQCKVRLLESGEIREVAFQGLAPTRAKRSDTTSATNQPHATPEAEWVKIGFPNFPFQAAFWANWKTGQTFCIPCSGVVRVPPQWQLDAITILLPPSSEVVAGEKLNFAIERVRSLLDDDHERQYKFGITSNPAQRLAWYAKDSIPLTSMTVVGISDERAGVSTMEAALIREFGINKHPRCLNVAVGGESAEKMSSKPFFVYMART